MAAIKCKRLRYSVINVSDVKRSQFLSLLKKHFAIWQALWPLITLHTLTNHQNRSILPDGSSIKVPVTAPVRASCLSPNLPLG